MSIHRSSVRLMCPHSPSVLCCSLVCRVVSGHNHGTTGLFSPRLIRLQPVYFFSLDRLSRLVKGESMRSPIGTMQRCKVYSHGSCSVCSGTRSQLSGNTLVWASALHCQCIQVDTYKLVTATETRACRSICVHRRWSASKTSRCILGMETRELKHVWGVREQQREVTTTS